MSETLEYTDRDGNTITIEPNTEWTNYGDVNPQLHGGRWVRFERDMWHIIETVSHHDLPDGMVDNEHLVQHTWVEPMDLFEGGNPDNGPTDTFSDILNQFSHVDGYVNALVDFDIEYFVADFTHYVHSNREDYPNDSNYWDYLEQFDIEQSD